MRARPRHIARLIALRSFGLLKTTVAIAPSCWTRRSVMDAARLRHAWLFRDFDDARGGELLDRGRVMADRREDLARVRAGLGRRRANRWRRAAQVHRQPEHLHEPERRVPLLVDEADGPPV